MRKNKLLLLLALLMTAATGAWAKDVITVTWSSGNTYENNNSKDGVTLSGDIVQYEGGEWMLAYYESKGTFTTELGNFTKIEITGGYIDGFSGEGWSGRTWTGNAAAVPFEGYLTDDSGDEPWTITFTIEPASDAPAGYTVTMKDGVKDADKWTVKVGEGEAQALPIGGLKGDGSETVTLQYNGRLKVKGVKATSDAAPAAVPVTSITLNKTATTISAGSTETLSVTAVAPDNATDKTYTWKTSDASIATVDQDGKVTAVAEGTVTIYAEANDGSGVKGNCTVTVTPATITVTINQSDWGSDWNPSFTKDGVTVSAGMIDPLDGNLMDGGTFSTTLGNFTKIVVTTTDSYVSGTGWSGGGSSMTWAGTPASTVSFSGEFMGMGQTQTTIVCTIVPKN